MNTHKCIKLAMLPIFYWQLLNVKREGNEHLSKKIFKRRIRLQKRRCLSARIRSVGKPFTSHCDTGAFFGLLEDTKINT